LRSSEKLKTELKKSNQQPTEKPWIKKEERDKPQAPSQKRC
jgi:hypothetical protein